MCVVAIKMSRGEEVEITLRDIKPFFDLYTANDHAIESFLSAVHRGDYEQYKAYHPSNRFYTLQKLKQVESVWEVRRICIDHISKICSERGIEVVKEGEQTTMYNGYACAVNAEVVVCGQSHVSGYGNAQIKAIGIARASVYDSSALEVYNEFYDDYPSRNPRFSATDNTRVIVHGLHCYVALHDNAEVEYLDDEKGKSTDVSAVCVFCEPKSLPLSTHDRRMYSVYSNNIFCPECNLKMRALGLKRPPKRTGRLTALKIDAKESGKRSSFGRKRASRPAQQERA